MSRSIRLHLQPVAGQPTPVWRSKFIVAAIALGFVGLAARAAYIQVFANDFFQRQGEVRFARTLELPANRGRILDRNGLILASSVPAPSIWAIPEDVERDKAKLQQLAKLLEMPLAELNKKLEDEDKTFVWLKRQVDDPVAKQIAALNLKGIYQRKEYKRQYPEGEAAAHVVGFTNVEDNGQEGMELAFNKDLAGRAGSRRVIKDRLGRVVEDVGDRCRRWTGATCSSASTARCSSSPTRSCATRCWSTRPRPAAWWCWMWSPAKCWRWPTTRAMSPDKRQNLSGAQLRNRALTDTFEPGSTMKPFIDRRWRWKQAWSRPQTLIQTAPGRITIGGFHHLATRTRTAC